MRIINSFFITIIAGFSTLIGSLLILFKFNNINKVVQISLSFSAGVMLSISIFDLFFESIRLLRLNYNIFLSIILFLIFFIFGCLLIIVINKFIKKEDSLYKIGIISMIGIIIHNIPEGMLTFITSTIDIKLGISMLIAISLHNIPEGISISIPIYYSTKSKSKAFSLALLSAFSESLGAVITYVFLYDYINDILLSLILSFVCGIMCYISIFELIKEALTYSNKKIFFISFILGIIIVIINLII